MSDNTGTDVPPLRPEAAATEVLAIIDAEAVLAACLSPSQDPDNPTAVPAGLVVLLHRSGDTQLADGDTDGLTISAPPGGLVRWQATSVSGSAATAVILYAVDFDGCLVEDLVAHQQEIMVPVPIPSDDDTAPPAYETGRLHKFLLHTRVATGGTTEVGLRFYVTYVEDGRVMTAGYFRRELVVTLA